MKHKIEFYQTADVVGILDYDDNEQLVINVETKNELTEVNVNDLLNKMIGSTVQIKSIIDKE